MFWVSWGVFFKGLGVQKDCIYVHIQYHIASIELSLKSVVWNYKTFEIHRKRAVGFVLMAITFFLLNFFP